LIDFLLVGGCLVFGCFELSDEFVVELFRELKLSLLLVDGFLQFLRLSEHFIDDFGVFFFLLLEHKRELLLLLLQLGLHEVVVDFLEGLPGLLALSGTQAQFLAEFLGFMLLGRDFLLELCDIAHLFLACVFSSFHPVGVHADQFLPLLLCFSAELLEPQLLLLDLLPQLPDLLLKLSFLLC
jgi:hypothetical protein